MDEQRKPVRVMLVDDEAEFRKSASRVLTRRGFEVIEAADGFKALELHRTQVTDVVLLDLKMPGLSGIETLQKMRETTPDLPVIILTGHGDLDGAMASMRLSIVDFLNKPLDLDLLAERIHQLLRQSAEERLLREKGIAELMVSSESYRRVYIDQPVAAAIEALWKKFSETTEDQREGLGHRSILAFDRRERFVGMIRFQNLLRLVIPQFLEDSPYSSYFTGMFMAQCKLITTKEIEDLIDDRAWVAESAPLIEAIHLMVSHHLINLPVLRKGELVGILRERDLIREISRHVGCPGLD